MPRKRTVLLMNKNSLVINCDGLCEPNPGGIATFGWVAKQGDKEIHSHNAFVRSGAGATNNLAEYSAVISALEWLLGSRYNDRHLIIKTDSQLVVRQINGIYAVRSPAIMPLYQKAIRLVKCFKSLNLEWCPREQNEEADELSRKAYERVLKAQKQTRQSKARDILSGIMLLSDGTFKVPSQSSPGLIYRVDIKRNTCTCPDFQTRGKKVGYCKHTLAVRMSLGTKIDYAL
jgi:ribonuclease HI